MAKVALIILGILCLVKVFTTGNKKCIDCGSSGAYNNSNTLSVDNTTRYLGSAYRLSQRVDVSYLSFGQAKRIVDDEIRNFWNKYSRGDGIRVAILDSGVEASQLDSLRVIRMIDWTSDQDNYDYLGHGTHIASILGSSDKDCPGVAPAVELFIHKIMNRDGLTYTSWILDALNDVLLSNVHIICMSIGGGDYEDQPLIDKIREVVANGVVILTAAGNDGPLFGTHSHPSSMKEAISIGAVDSRHKIASFSSRGMTLEEQQFRKIVDDSSLLLMNHSYNKITADSLSLEQFLEYTQIIGRPKPDVLVEAVTIASSGLKSKTGNCVGLSGTSYGVPILAGYLSLLFSAIPFEYRLFYMNLAGVRYILGESCIPLSNNSIYEQGMGLFEFGLAKKRIIASLESIHLSRNNRFSKPFHRNNIGIEASVYPFRLLFNSSFESCSFWWPHCIFDSDGEAKPPLSLQLNLVICFPLSPIFSVKAIKYVSESGEKPLWDVKELSSFWPFVGILNLFIAFPHTTDLNDMSLGNNNNNMRRIRGKFCITLTSYASEMKLSTLVHLDWSVHQKEKRKIILWDAFHQISYPIPFVPTDDIQHSQLLLDRFGDLPFTNFRNLYQRFTSGPFDMKTFSYPWTTLEKIWNENNCSDDLITALFCVDPEDWLEDEEIDAVDRLVFHHGLSLLLVAEWFNEETMNDLRYWDASTSRWWSPVVGGANMQGINSLGRRFGFLFGDVVFDASLCTSYEREQASDYSTQDDPCNGTHSISFQSGNGFYFVQEGSQILFAHNKKDIRRIWSQDDRNDFDSAMESIPILSQEQGNYTSLENVTCEIILEQDLPVFLYRRHGKGNLIVYGDSNCLDSSLSEDSSSCIEDLYQVVRLVTSQLNLSLIFPHVEYIHRNTCFPSAGKMSMNSWNGTLLEPHSYHWTRRRSSSL
ncbi:Subtilisin-like protease SBT6.1 [Galdieria sulphuraria]|nr:Subtilisin-like protease SBT6.1 [Galdieria sulphuraria]